MKVYRCSKCQKKDGYLVFRKTKHDKFKYPYVGHYDPTKKSKKKWCSLNPKQLNSIDFNEDWYDDEYSKLIQKIQYDNYMDIENKKHQYGFQNKAVNQKIARLVRRAGRLLNKNGFLTYRIADRLDQDITHVFITERNIAQRLPSHFSE